MTPILRMVVAVPVVVAGVLCLSNCSIGGNGTSTPEPAHLVVTQPRTLAAGQSVTLTVSSSNGTTFKPSWNLAGLYLTSPGTLSGQAGNTIVYTAPLSPPLYTLPSILPQGQAEVQVQDTTGVLQATDAQFVILAPVTAYLTPATATVGRGQTLQFTGYATGATNGAVTFGVNGTPSGSSTFGAISNGGMYLAPLAVPPGGTVTVSAVAQADSTKVASSVVTIN